MKEALVAGGTFLCLGFLLLAVGLTAIAVSPGGLGFFATVEVSHGWPYEYLQLYGLVSSIIGVIATPTGVAALIHCLLGRTKRN